MSEHRIPPCPVCEYWDDEHAPTCVVSRLQALGVEGRQAHRRALLLVTLLTAEQPTSLVELSDATGIPLFHLGPTVHGLFAEGLAHPGFSSSTTIALTSAPHVQQACLAAADLLGMVLTQPRPPLSPMLGQPELPL